MGEKQSYKKVSQSYNYTSYTSNFNGRRNYSMSLKDWLAFDLGTDVAHQEALHYVKQDFFTFKRDDLEVACVTVFDVLDQEFKIFGFRKSLWREFLAVN